MSIVFIFLLERNDSTHSPMNIPLQNSVPDIKHRPYLYPKPSTEYTTIMVLFISVFVFSPSLTSKTYCTLFFYLPVLSTGVVEYTDSRWSPPLSVMGITLNGGASILELWGMWNNPSLTLLPGPLWPIVLIPIKVPSMDQTELFNHLLNLKPFNWVQTND